MPRDFCALRCFKPVDLPGEGPTETRFRLVNGDRSFAAAMVYEVDKGFLGKTKEKDPEHVTVDGSKIALIVQSDQWPPDPTNRTGPGISTLYLDVADVADDTGKHTDDDRRNALQRYFIARIRSDIQSDIQPEGFPPKDPCSAKALGRFPIPIEGKPQTATITIRMQEGEGDLQVDSQVLHAKHGQFTILVEVDGHVIAGGLAGPPMVSKDTGDKGDTHPHV